MQLTAERRQIRRHGHRIVDRRLRLGEPALEPPRGHPACPRAVVRATRAVSSSASRRSIWPTSRATISATVTLPRARARRKTALGLPWAVILAPSRGRAAQEIYSSVFTRGASGYSACECPPAPGGTWAGLRAWGVSVGPEASGPTAFVSTSTPAVSSAAPRRSGRSAPRPGADARADPRVAGPRVAGPPLSSPPTQAQILARVGGAAPGAALRDPAAEAVGGDERGDQDPRAPRTERGRRGGGDRNQDRGQRARRRTRSSGRTASSRSEPMRGPPIPNRLPQYP